MIDAFADIEARIDAADKRYGPFASAHEGLGVALEEWQELIEAVRSNSIIDVQSECLDLAAVCIRLAMCLGEPQTALRSVK